MNDRATTPPEDDQEQISEHPTLEELRSQAAALSEEISAHLGMLGKGEQIINLLPLGVVTSDYVLTAASGEKVPGGIHSAQCQLCDAVSRPFDDDPRPVYEWMSEHARIVTHNRFTVTTERLWRVRALHKGTEGTFRGASPAYPFPRIINSETIQSVKCWWCSGPTESPILLRVDLPPGAGGFAYACVTCTRRAAREHLRQCATCDPVAQPTAWCETFEAYVFAFGTRLKLAGLL